MSNRTTAVLFACFCLCSTVATVYAVVGGDVLPALALVPADGSSRTDDGSGNGSVVVHAAVRQPVLEATGTDAALDPRPPVHASGGYVPDRNPWWLVADLAHDNIALNAAHAMRELRRMGADAIPYLDAALVSTDRQQRQLGARVLRGLDRPPSEDLLRVTVEGLRHDRILYDPEMRAYTSYKNAQDGLWYLDEHIADAQPHLERVIGSVDPQQRFYVAYLLATHRKLDQQSRICAVLIEHLRDNETDGDAVMATRALYKMGPTVLPYLVDARVHADRQARELIDLVRLDLVQLTFPGKFGHRR